jgi:hypothetical protein
MWLRGHRDGVEDPRVRTGARMIWLDQVLAPLDLPPGRKAPLRAALALTFGIEPIVILKDVCHLDDDTLAVLRQAALATLRTALQEAPE